MKELYVAKKLKEKFPDNWEDAIKFYYFKSWIAKSWPNPHEEAGNTFYFHLQLIFIQEGVGAKFYDFYYAGGESKILETLAI